MVHREPTGETILCNSLFHCSNASHVIDVLYVLSMTYARLFQDQMSRHSDVAISKALPLHITHI